MFSEREKNILKHFWDTICGNFNIYQGDGIIFEERELSSDRRKEFLAWFVEENSEQNYE